MYRRLRRHRSAPVLIVALIIALLAAAVAGCGPDERPAPAPPPATGGPTGNPSGVLEVCFIDVGQADSILVRSDDATMLIDAGNNGDAETVVAFLKEAGVEKLDLVVGTHPHEDHIGGLDAVIRAFPVDRVCLPRATTTTRTFEDLLAAIKERGLTIDSPAADSQFTLGDARGTFLAPRGDDYDDLNDYSLVIRLTFGRTAFLFTGDAGRDSEQEMLAAGVELQADVLKVGHHGSVTATSAAFLDRVSPAYAVISVGEDNDYGHPHREVVDRLVARGVSVLRTDVSGTIVVTSDGSELVVSTKPSK
ncbi:MAG: ComEC/Rec2 family competence protein [Chloroflexota bacterium]